MKNNAWRKQNHFCLYTPGLRLLDKPVTTAPRHKESKAQRGCVTCPLHPKLRQVLSSLLSATCSLFFQFSVGILLEHCCPGALFVALSPEAARRDQVCPLPSHVLGVTKPKHNEPIYILPSGQQSHGLWNMKMKGEEHFTLLRKTPQPALCIS